MNYLVHAGLSNALLALVPAALALLCRWRGGTARLVRGLWVIALLKLLTPPILLLPVTWMAPNSPQQIVKMPAAIPSLPAAEDPNALTVLMTEVKTPETPENANALAPIETSATPGNSPAEPTANGKTTLTNAKDGTIPELIRWETPVASLWICGAVAVLAWGIREILAFRKWVMAAEPATEAIRAMTKRIGQGLGLRHTPWVGLIDAPMSPVLWGAGWRPRILLPKGLWESLANGPREALLAHELAHYRRKDHWMRWIEFTCQIIYWWHPLVWAGARQMRKAEEEATDAIVVSALPAHGPAYARALLAVVENVAQSRWRVPAGASGMSEFSDLTRRMKMIMEPKTRKMNWLAWGILGAGSLALLPVLPVGGAQTDASAPIQLAQAAPTPGAPGPVDSAPPTPDRTSPPTTEELQKRLADERQKMETERRKYEEERRQIEDARRKMEDERRQQAINASHAALANETMVQLRELEHAEFMDTGKEINSARLEAEMLANRAQLTGLVAKLKRLSEAAKNGAVTEEEVADAERNVETAKARYNIASLELQSWKKYGIVKREMELKQQLEEAKRDLLLRNNGLTQSRAGENPAGKNP